MEFKELVGKLGEPKSTGKWIVWNYQDRAKVEPIIKDLKTNGMAVFVNGNGEIGVLAERVEGMPKVEFDPSVVGRESEDETMYKVYVRRWVTKPSNDKFLFQKEWNQDTPMPMRVMVGNVTRETKNMVRLKLHAEPMPTGVCLQCGRKLTHPVSLLYGIGPECGGHFHKNPFKTKEELAKYYDKLKKDMAKVTWEGWVPRSAIIDMVPETENLFIQTTSDISEESD